MSAPEQDSQWTFCRQALAQLRPFALCCFPGESRLRLFAAAKPNWPNKTNWSNKPNWTNKTNSTIAAEGGCFEIVPWLGKFADRISLPAVDAAVSAEKACCEAFAGEALGGEALGGEVKACEALEYETQPEISRERYLQEVAAVIESCAARKGKTVYSRVIAGCNPRLDIVDAAQRLFAAFPDAFCFLYYTPQTGCWLGASPETLLSVDYLQNSFSTMALAGTRKADASDAPWDEKNLRENRFVVDFFREKLAAAKSTDVAITEPFTVRYGAIEHLCCRVAGRLGTDDAAGVSAALLDAINPTPALCGTPTADAIADIERHELHCRGCYGGYLALRDGHRLDAFVNLRCAQIALDDTGRFELYAGGGITGQSDPESEYTETADKASALLGILSAVEQ